MRLILPVYNRIEIIAVIGNPFDLPVVNCLFLLIIRHILGNHLVDDLRQLVIDKQILRVQFIRITGFICFNHRRIIINLVNPRFRLSQQLVHFLNHAAALRKHTDNQHDDQKLQGQPAFPLQRAFVSRLKSAKCAFAIRFLSAKLIFSPLSIIPSSPCYFLLLAPFPEKIYLSGSVCLPLAGCCGQSVPNKAIPAA